MCVCVCSVCRGGGYQYSKIGICICTENASNDAGDGTCSTCRLAMSTCISCSKKMIKRMLEEFAEVA